MLDPTTLSINDVKVLIAAEKNPKDELKYAEVYNQITNTLVVTPGSYRCEVIDNKREIVYKLLIHETPIKTKFTISLMFAKNYYHLIRFDFGDDLRHTNNKNTDNEEVIVGSHVHFNAPPGKYNNKNVIPIGKIEQFKNIKVIRDAFLEFIQYTNIKKGSD